MLGLIKITIPGFSNLNSKTEKWGTSGYWKVFLLGVVFALAFCPYSGVLYFGMLIPMTISHAQGLVLPIFYAIGTSIPVIIFAFVIAFSMQNLNNLFTSLKNFEYWFRKVVAVLFIGAGTYLTYITWIN